MPALLRFWCLRVHRYFMRLRAFLPTLLLRFEAANATMWVCASLQAFFEYCAWGSTLRYKSWIYISMAEKQVGLLICWAVSYNDSDTANREKRDKESRGGRKKSHPAVIPFYIVELDPFAARWLMSWLTLDTGTLNISSRFFFAFFLAGV